MRGRTPRRATGRATRRTSTTATRCREESRLEETYYFRIHPAQGFGVQRVYSDDRTLDETLAVGDRDTVLVPRGYHTVRRRPATRVYYLNAMACPAGAWAVANDPDHAWTKAP